MKKGLITILLFIYGIFVHGASGKSTVTVRAEIISEELIIGGLNHKPLILDFGKSIEDRKLDFMVQYSTVKNTVTSSSQINFALDSHDIELKSEDEDFFLASNIKLNRESQILSHQDSQVIGSIQGNLKGVDFQTIKGVYTGITHLNITVIPM